MSLIFLISSCQFWPDEIHVSYSVKKASSTSFSPIVTSIKIINHQIIVDGLRLDEITSLKLKEGTTEIPLVIESSGSTSITANTTSNVTITAGRSFDLILGNTNGVAGSFPVDFSLCLSLKNTSGFNCALSANDGDVLSYDSNNDQWIPRNVNGLNYKGTYNASTGIVPPGSPSAGDYYVVNVAGTINSVSYGVGDWISFNGDDWQKIANTKSVISVFGRSGNIKAKKGDYNLDLMADVDLTTTPPVPGDVLIYSSGKWIPGTASPGAPSAPTGNAGGDLSGTYPAPTLTNTGVTAGTYKSVTVNGKGRVTSALNPTTLAGFGITDPIVTNLTATLPLSIAPSGSTRTVSIATANNVTNGKLTSADWNTFNGKQNALSAGVTINGVTYPANGTQTLQVALAPASATDAANKLYVDSTFVNNWSRISAGNVYRSTGYVGIRNTSPSFNLTLGNGTSLDGSIMAKGFGTTGIDGQTLTASGAGRRFIWYPKKSAFRVGGVSGAQWDDANIGLWSTAFGYNTKASGDYSIAIGSDTVASGTGAIALNNTTTASGTGSIAFNTNTISSGNYSIAANTSTTASGDYSMAFGLSSVASNYAAFASGNSTVASGMYSAAMGISTTSPAYNQFTIGQFNLNKGTEDPNAWVPSDPHFVVGIGTSAAAKANGLVILKNGNVGVGVDDPITKLQVSGVISPATDGTYDLGTSSLRFKDIYATNGVINTSDARLKKEIKDSDLGLNFITKLNPVSFFWNSGSDKKHHYGLIAQETLNVIADEKKTSGKKEDIKNTIVHFDSSSNRYGIRYTEIISPLIKAIQELFAELQDLNQKLKVDKEIEKLDNEIGRLEREIASVNGQNEKLRSYICEKQPSHEACVLN